MTAEERQMTKAEFVAWHEAFKKANGYPLQGRNAATGELVDIGWTTEYVDFVEISPADVRVVIDVAELQRAKVPAPAPGKLAAVPAVLVTAELAAEPNEAVK